MNLRIFLVFPNFRIEKKIHLKRKIIKTKPYSQEIISKINKLVRIKRHLKKKMEMEKSRKKFMTDQIEENGIEKGKTLMEKQTLTSDRK